jgi:AraC family transcriptional regulator
LLKQGSATRLMDVTCRLGAHDRPYPEKHQDAWTFALVRRGHFDYRAADTNRLHRLQPGWILVGRPGQEFEVSHDCDGGDDCVSIVVPQELVDASIESPVMPPVARFSAWMERARVGELDLDETACALSDSLSSTPAPQASPTAAERRRIDRAIGKIEHGFRAQLSLTDLAIESGLSAYHFLRIFRRLTGTTPHQYVVNARLRWAAQMLLETSQPVTEIAYESGFADLSNFTRTFHRAIGQSPRAFRGVTR